MIVYPFAGPAGNRLLVTNQIDHAAFSAELLSLWRADGLPDNPRRQSLVRGTREHDNGWAEADSAPRVRRQGDEHAGRPHDFRSIPMDVRLDIFERGVHRKPEADPEAWVYVVRHALALHQDDGGSEEWDRALAEWQELEDRLREDLYLSEDDLASDYRHLWIADAASLAVCLRWQDPRTVNGTTMHVTADAGDEEDGMAVTLHLEPFPLAGSTTFHVSYRIIPDRTYTGDTDLAMELATSRWQKLRVRVAP